MQSNFFSSEGQNKIGLLIFFSVWHFCMSPTAFSCISGRSSIKNREKKKRLGPSLHLASTNWKNRREAWQNMQIGQRWQKVNVKKKKTCPNKFKKCCQVQSSRQNWAQSCCSFFFQFPSTTIIRHLIIILSTYNYALQQVKDNEDNPKKQKVFFFAEEIARLPINFTSVCVCVWNRRVVGAVCVRVGDDKGNTREETSHTTWRKAVRHS